MLATLARDDIDAVKKLVKISMFNYLLDTSRAETLASEHEVFDVRKLLLTPLLKKPNSNINSLAFEACFRSMLQYQVACGKAIIVHFLGEPDNVQTNTGKEADSQPHLTQIFEPLLQQLEQQLLAVRRFKNRTKEVEVLQIHVEDDISEYEYLIEELKIIVEHRRAAMSHRLNQTLMRESKANLRIAQRSIKESQRSGLRTYTFSHPILLS